MMTDFNGFTQPFGSITAGSGRQVLPAPSIDDGDNPHIRSTAETTFTWGASYAEPISDVSSGGDPIPVPGESAETYILEVTPDLGWTDWEAMFQPAVLGRTDVGNESLKRYAGLAIGSDLVATSASGSSLETAISYDIAIADLSNLIGEGYPDFLWRVRGVRDDGAEGTPSAIQRFRGRVEVNTSDIASDSDWTIDPISLPVKSTFITLSGTKTPAISYIEVDGNSGLSTNLSSVRWTADVMVPPSGSTVLLRAVDTQGNTSTYKTVDLTIDTADLTTQPISNSFDEFGFALNLERLPDEDNESYRSRLLDINVRRGSPQYSGLINSIARELDLDQIDSALILTPGTNSANGQRFSDVYFTLGSQYARIESPLLKSLHEYHKVGNWSWSITLDSHISESTIKVESPIGVEIDDSNYDLDLDRGYNSVVFTDETWAGKNVWVSYEYEERFDTVNTTISELQTWISSVTSSSDALLEVDADSTLDTSSSCDEIERLPRTLISRSQTTNSANEDVKGVPIRWSQAILWTIEDTETKERFLNSENNYFGTEIEGWARRVRGLSANQWGHAVADRSIWMSSDEVDKMDSYLDTTYDSSKGFWASSDPSKSKRYTTEEAHAFNYISPGDGSDMIRIGLDRSKLKSGIGDGTDLYVVLSEDDEPFSYIQGESELTETTVTTVSSTQVLDSNVAASSTALAPTSLAAEVSGTILTISWDEVTNVSVAYYEVRKGIAWAGSQHLGTTSNTSLSTIDWAPTGAFTDVDENLYVVAVDTSGTYGDIAYIDPDRGDSWYDTATYTTYTANAHDVTTSLPFDGGDYSNGTTENDLTDDQVLTLSDTDGPGMYITTTLDTATVGKKTIGATMNAWISRELIQLDVGFDWDTIDVNSTTDWGVIDPSQWATEFVLEFAHSEDDSTYSEWVPMNTSVVTSARYFKLRISIAAPGDSIFPYVGKLSWLVQDTP